MAYKTSKPNYHLAAKERTDQLPSFIPVAAIKSGKVEFLNPQLAYSPGLKQHLTGYRSKVGSNLQTDLTG